MSLVTTAILPIILLLGTGVCLRRRFVTAEVFWRGFEWLSYRVFTPALFVISIGDTDLTAVSPAPLILSLAVPIVAVAAFVILLRPLIRANGAQLTSMVQGSIRINTYIGLVFASALQGQQGLAIFALACVLVVPLVNLICVSTLAVHGDKTALERSKPLWRELAQNPLIQGCLIGLTINMSGLALPGFFHTFLELLAAPALASGTLIAGAALRFTFRRRDVIDIGLTTVLKLGILPLAAMAIAIPLDVTGPTLTCIILICAVPTAPSAYVLAARMGGDTRLMAAITGVQTLLAIATMPALLVLAERLTG